MIGILHFCMIKVMRIRAQYTSYVLSLTCVAVSTFYIVLYSHMYFIVHVSSVFDIPLVTAITSLCLWSIEVG